MAGEILEFLHQIGKLKTLDRQGWVIRSIPKPESVAGHMYRMSIIAMFALDRSLTADLDMDKVTKMCLVHDMAECIVGDITPHEGIPEEEKHRRELEAMNSLSRLLPNSNAQEMMSLFNEYEERQSPESKLTKEIDVFDLLQQAHELEQSEYERTGKLPDLTCFFRESLCSKITHPSMKKLLEKLLLQRSDFLAHFQSPPLESLQKSEGNLAKA